MSQVITKFADDMMREFEANQHKGGWDDMTVARCLLRAEQEMGELRRAVARGAPFKVVRSEAADVGNFLAFLVWNACEEQRAALRRTP